MITSWNKNKVVTVSIGVASDQIGVLFVEVYKGKKLINKRSVVSSDEAYHDAVRDVLDTLGIEWSKA